MISSILHLLCSGHFVAKLQTFPRPSKGFCHLSSDTGGRKEGLCAFVMITGSHRRSLSLNSLQRFASVIGPQGAVNLIMGLIVIQVEKGRKTGLE